MIAAGAVEEVARLVARGLDASLPAMKALGVGPIAAHLSGAISAEAALAAARMDTRHYAKRQTTWFRNQTADWPRIEATDTAGQIAAWRGLALTEVGGGAPAGPDGPIA